MLCFHLEMGVSLLAVYLNPLVLNCHLEILTGLESEIGKGQGALKSLSSSSNYLPIMEWRGRGQGKWR